MYAMVIDENSLHLEVGLLAVFLVLEFDERILQTVTRALVSNYLTRNDFSKAAEYGIQIVICIASRSAKGSLEAQF